MFLIYITDNTSYLSILFTILIIMSKDEESPYLLFGQGILIEGEKNDEDKGLLTTKGYADVKAKY